MKDIPTSPRIAFLKKKRRIRRIRLSILFFIFFICLIFASSYFSSYHKISINNITINGNSVIDENEVRDHVKSLISGKYFGLFSKNNFLIYPKNEIYEDLFLNFPRIEKLDIKINKINNLMINISERAGSYLYCGDSLPEHKNEIGENCYFVNNDGYIFDEAPYFSGDVYFKFFKNIDGDPLKPSGHELFKEDKFHEIVRFIDQINYLGFKTSYLFLDNDGIYYLYLSSNNNENPKIIFKKENDLSKILSNLSTAMNKDEFKNEINKKYDKLLYIDLRFKNKVLYKFSSQSEILSDKTNNNTEE